MTATFPVDADAWAEAWRDRLNDSEKFADEAADLAATLLCVVEPDESYDGDPVRVLVAVADGECQRAEAVTDESVEYDYALRAPYEAWKALLRQELSVSEAVMGGPFDLEGDTLALLNHRAAVAELVRTARLVDTDFAY